MISKTIPLVRVEKFSEFDRGENVSQHIEGEHEPKPGEMFGWEFETRNGYAEVIEAQAPRHGFTYITFRKQA